MEANNLGRSQADVSDPSLLDGCQEIFQREIECQITHEMSSNQNLQDYLMLRLFSKPDGKLKLQVTSQEDMYLMYVGEWDTRAAKLIIEDNKLTVSSDKLPSILKQIIAGCPLDVLCNISFMSSGAIVRFVQNSKSLGGRENLLLKFSLSKASDSMVKKSLNYRFERMKTKKILIDQGLVRLHDIIKVDPQLMLSITKDIRKGLY